MTANAEQSPLDADRLMAAAEAATDLSDWGADLSWQTGLHKLIDAIEHMSCASLLRESVAAQVVQLLSTRLRLEEDARQHPEILQGQITAPLIVTGLPRTGTTWLFELLALDPVVRAPLEWELGALSPPPEAATFDTDPRIAAAQAGVDAMLQAVPELATMHPFGAQLPAECNAIMTLHFASSNFWATYAVPEYIDWLTFDHPQGVMNTHRRVLQQLQWKGPRGRWTLKSPPYMLMLEDLLAAYPDACIVQTHREPAKMVASLANMIRALRRVRDTGIPELLEPREIARSVLRHFGTALERGTKSREDPAVDGRFVDIAYRDLVINPLAAVQRIYDGFGLPWTSEFEQRLTAHITAQRSSGHGKHKYDMAEFGVDELDLPNQFPEYRARFGDLLSDS